MKSLTLIRLAALWWFKQHTHTHVHIHTLTLKSRTTEDVINHHCSTKNKAPSQTDTYKTDKNALELTSSRKKEITCEAKTPKNIQENNWKKNSKASNCMPWAHISHFVSFTAGDKHDRINFEIFAWLMIGWVIKFQFCVMAVPSESAQIVYLPEWSLVAWSSIRNFMWENDEENTKIQWTEPKSIA